jgi:hypothetical protein
MVTSGGREGPFLPQILPHGEGLFRHADQAAQIFGSGRLSQPDAVIGWLEFQLPMQVPDMLHSMSAGPARRTEAISQF